MFESAHMSHISQSYPQSRTIQCDAIPSTVTTALLDVDGTLLDSLAIWHRIDIDFFADRGMTLPDDYGQHIEHMSFTEAADFTVRAYHFDCTPQQLQDEWYARARQAYTQVALKPYVQQYLQLLQQSGIYRVVVTGLSRELYECACRATGLDQLIDRAFVLEDYGQVGKGNTRVLNTVLSTIQQSAEQCIVFEDTLEGIRTAHQLGMYTCAVLDPETHHQWPELRRIADWSITTFREAPMATISTSHQSRITAGSTDMNQPITYDSSPRVRLGESGGVLERFAQASASVWEASYQQPFLRELAAGTLDRQRFTAYMIQDYLYLQDYANVHAIAFSICTDPTIKQALAHTLESITHELDTVHETYAREYGISRDELQHAEQSAYARAYTTSMVATAYTGTLLDTLVALLPCAWVYADYGTRMAAECGGVNALTGHPYETWIRLYASEEFWDSSQWLRDAIERLAAHEDESTLARLERAFIRGVDLERIFWASAYRMERGWAI